MQRPVKFRNECFLSYTSRKFDSKDRPERRFWHTNCAAMKWSDALHREENADSVVGHCQSSCPGKRRWTGSCNVCPIKQYSGYWQDGDSARSDMRTLTCKESKSGMLQMSVQHAIWTDFEIAIHMYVLGTFTGRRVRHFRSRIRRARKEESKVGAIVHQGFHWCVLEPWCLAQCGKVPKWDAETNPKRLAVLTVFR